MPASFRRVLLGAFAVLPMLGAASFAPAGTALAANAPSAATAQSFIKQSGEKLVGIVNGSGSAQAKAQKLRDLVDNIVAVDKIGRFVIGRYWRVATPQQRTEYMHLFHQTIANSITNQIQAYEGVKFAVKGTKSGPEGEMVDTSVTRPGQAPADVQWVVASVGGQPKIIDVVVAGTSLRITTRSDYSSVINDNGGQVSALLTAMKQQIKRNAAG